MKLPENLKQMKNALMKLFGLPVPQPVKKWHNLYNEKDGIFNVYCGSDITSTINEAIELSALAANHPVTFNFNDVMVTVVASSDPELIYRDWHRAMQGYTDKNVGPNPNPVLTNEEMANDARIEAENQREAEIRHAEYEAEALAKTNAVEARMTNAPEIELSDVEGWNKCKDINKDPYGAAAVTYAERWARLMQMEMASGKTLAEVANDTSHEADLEGITGFMHGCAVSILSQCWAHGEELRRWHNLDSQIGNEGEKANEEGGVLNPALLVLGSNK